MAAGYSAAMIAADSRAACASYGIAPDSAQFDGVFKTSSRLVGRADRRCQ